MTSEGDETLAVRMFFTTLGGARKCRLVPSSQYKHVSKHGAGMVEVVMGGFPSYVDQIVPEASLTCAGEIKLLPDPATLIQVPWHPKHVAVIANGESAPGVASKYCPRGALQKVVDALKAEHGVELQIGFEIEFILLDPSKQGVVAEDGRYSYPPPVARSTYASSTLVNDHAEVLDEMMETLQKMNIDVVVVHTESAFGQFEIATGHAPPVEAADKLLLSREAISAIAKKHGLVATFIPKFNMMQAGNGCHCNMSIKKEGEAIPAGDEQTLSPATKKFLAGVLHHLDAVACFIGSSVNSYRRYAPGCWAGAFKSWGVSNKEATMRVVYPSAKGDGEARCEVKTFDSTANPHLGVAALAVAGMLGLGGGLDLPPPINDVDPGSLAEEKQLTRMPTSLSEAVGVFEANEEFKQAFAKVVGNEMIHAFIALRKHEAEDLGKLEFEEEVYTLYQCY